MATRIVQILHAVCVTYSSSNISNLKRIKRFTSNDFLLFLIFISFGIWNMCHNWKNAAAAVHTKGSSMKQFLSGNFYISLFLSVYLLRKKLRCTHLYWNASLFFSLLFTLNYCFENFCLVRARVIADSGYHLCIVYQRALRTHYTATQTPVHNLTWMAVGSESF